MRRLALALLAVLVLGGCASKNLDYVPKDRDAALTPGQLYEKGTSYLERGRYYRARTVLEKILGRSGVPPELLGNANLAIADAYFFDGGIINVAEALSRYTSFLTFYPNHPRADYVQYQLGLCYLKQSLSPDKDQATTQQALDAFRKVESIYPASSYIPLAREKADQCRNRLAEATLRVGVFYAKRKAHEGAISRFRFILSEYPRFGRMDKIYFLLAESLLAVNRPSEASPFYQKILDEHPNGRYAGEARDRLEELKGGGSVTGAAPPEPAPGGSSGLR